MNVDLIEQGRASPHPNADNSSAVAHDHSHRNSQKT